LDGIPTLLTAYGGFNVSMTPSFSRTAYFVGWSMAEFIAVANLRGGAGVWRGLASGGDLGISRMFFDDMIAPADI